MGTESLHPSGYRRQPIILLIEDERAIAALVEESLQQSGYRVVTASDGLEGLARIQDIEPDIVICDRMMPSMTGSELLERLRSIYPQYKTLPFIFLTALTDTQDKLAVDHLKPYAYLEKPVNFDVLEQTIEQALETAVA